MQQAMQVLTSHASQDWFTPPEYIELVRAVLGEIDLDPAANPVASKWIQSRTAIQPPASGLNFSWWGRVFVNPPYGKTDGKSNQGVWSAKMAQEFEAGNFGEGILLVNSTHGYKWFEDLWIKYPVCCVRERIRFIKPDGTQGGQAKRGQCFVYFGLNVERFKEVFSMIGRIILPEV